MDLVVIKVLALIFASATLFVVLSARERQSVRLPPPYDEYARMARWLVHQNEWGVVSTTSKHLRGIPFGNAVSYADGPSCESTGRLLFYLTAMDATAQDLALSSNASLTVCEAQLPGACAGIDPEDPTCAKLSISGNLQPLPEEQLEEAERLLFTRHPAMRNRPAGHAFQIYELHIATARLLDWYGGPHDITAADYFAAELAGRHGGYRQTA
ncbi:hypothetical protein ACK3TF_000832 [Chlorella vulgaris]